MGESKSLAESLGRGIAYARERSGVSQAVLAERSGVHRNQVSQLERGKSGGRNGAAADPHLSTVLKLAAALHVPPASLLFSPDDPLAVIEVMPGVEVEAYKAFGWFIGAGSPVGMTHDRAYVPDGLETDSSMRGMLQLLDLDRQIADAEHSLLQVEGGAKMVDAGLMSSDVADMLEQSAPSAEDLRTRIGALHRARANVIEGHRRKASLRATVARGLGVHPETDRGDD
ncbi:helix-turn-helix transcriptional regulator [Tsukamurella sp. NPDC003166]|uniref:helix-turn-helix domain-containing protein n=1 Tax=Tsukamurella sp. NPDC003166 TaxID=3154444 RepID=UPI0033BDB9E1